MNKLIAGTALLATVFLVSPVRAMTPYETNGTNLTGLSEQLRILTEKLISLQNLSKSVTISGNTVGGDASAPKLWCLDVKKEKNLHYGDSGEAVGLLQIALDKSGFVISESDKNGKFFGESTAAAVVGFQQKYKEEILAPFGLMYGTGFVGTKTWEKLNSIYGCDKICPQVITYAIYSPTVECPQGAYCAPALQVCQEFPTPCAVPKGWKVTDKCDDKTPKSSSLRIISPNGGEQIVADQHYKITWDYSGKPFTSIDILLVGYNQSGIQLGDRVLIMGSVSTNQRSFYWMPDATLSSFSGSNVSKYKIQIRESNDSPTALSDASDSYFTIKRADGRVCAQVITYAVSSAGECREFPTPCDVLTGWRVTDKCDCSKYTCPPQGDTCEQKCKSQGYTSGSCQHFAVSPEGLRAKEEYEKTHTAIGYTSDCYLPLQQVGSSVNCYCEPKKPQKSITLISPNGGESWKFGEEHTVKWEATGFNKNNKFTLYLYFPDGRTCQLATLDGQARSFVFRPVLNQSCRGSSLKIVSGKYSMAILSDEATPALDGITSDKSDAPFELSIPELSIQILDPRAREKIYLGDTTYIRWSSNANYENCILDLYDKDKKLVTKITDLRGVRSPFAWRVSRSIALGSYLIGINDPVSGQTFFSGQFEILKEPTPPKKPIEDPGVRCECYTDNSRTTTKWTSWSGRAVPCADIGHPEACLGKCGSGLWTGGFDCR
jgi:hypothetical protein